MFTLPGVAASIAADAHSASAPRGQLKIALSSDYETPWLAAPPPPGVDPAPWAEVALQQIQDATYYAEAALEEMRGRVQAEVDERQRLDERRAELDRLISELAARVTEWEHELATLASLTDYVNSYVSQNGV